MDPSTVPIGPPEDRELDGLLGFLRRERGFDFSGYKRTSLARRVRQRMDSVGASSMADYLLHIEQNAEEVVQLFDALLINVTAFFRDRAAWEALAGRLASIVEPDGSAPIRVWSAGCSSGEEPYSLAIVLREILGEGAFERRVKIYATDIDDDALALARNATYPARTVEDVPSALLERYFVPEDGRFTVREELRRVVVFGRHDLLQDPPIPNVDVVTCRNLLMYLTAPTQERVVEALHFALRPQGLLFLGRAEMLLSRSPLFVPLDLTQRLFTPAREGPPRLTGETSARRATPRARLETVLQSTNEELEAANEELQWTNDELEAMNEELQATNEELQTINEELRQRGAELNAARAILGAVLGQSRTGVAVLDRELRVGTWSARMTELAGVRPDDAVGAALPALAATFRERLPLGPSAQLAASLRAAIDARTESTWTVDVRSAVDRSCSFEVRVLPLLVGRTSIGVVLLVEGGG